jgi:CTD small phosphatase-like protein 2
VSIGSRLTGNAAASAVTKPVAVVPPTPSKIMFSPGLRTDPADGAHQAGAQHPNESSSSSTEQQEQAAPNTASLTPAVSSDTVDHQLPAHHIYNLDEEGEGEEEEDDSDVFNPYQFIAGLPKHSTVMVPNKIVLPSATSSDRITLVLDLDETLVHCTVDPVENPDLVFPVS